jgi:2-beta-glucuronyltransferase
MSEAAPRRRALFFTQQTAGLAARKTSMIFMAEALAALGWDVGIVTVQLSHASRFGAAKRLAAIPHAVRNRWYDATPLRAFVWVPVVHPLRPPGEVLQRLSGGLVDLYAAMLPDTLLHAAAASDLVVIESCAAVALFRRLKAAAPNARFVYSMSDRLDAVGMHPALQRRLVEDASAYDLVRVPAEALLDDLPGANARYIPQGLDLAPFGTASENPYAVPVNVVAAGDMMLDQPLFASLCERFPGVEMHYFGRQSIASIHRRRNLVDHGEVPFERLVPYIQHADAGLALYRAAPGLDYLAQSSLKAVQYAYAGVPVVAPHFVANGLSRAVGYTPGNPVEAATSLARALAMGRSTEDRPAVLGWNEVALRLLAGAGFPISEERGDTPADQQPKRQARRHRIDEERALAE